MGKNEELIKKVNDKFSKDFAEFLGGIESFEPDYPVNISFMLKVFRDLYIGRFSPGDALVRNCPYWDFMEHEVEGYIEIGFENLFNVRYFGEETARPFLYEFSKKWAKDNLREE